MWAVGLLHSSTLISRPFDCSILMNTNSVAACGVQDCVIVVACGRQDCYIIICDEKITSLWNVEGKDNFFVDCGGQRLLLCGIFNAKIISFWNVDGKNHFFVECGGQKSLLC